MENNIYYVFFFETFKEEIEKLKQSLDEKFKVCYTQKTIQEWLLNDNNEIFKTQCPSMIVSIRTQSKIPKSWFGSNYFKGILTFKSALPANTKPLIIGLLFLVKYFFTNSLLLFK